MYRLRELERKDLKQINIWRNDSDLIKLLGANFRFINTEVDNSWYDNYMSNRAREVRCAIIDSENEDKLVGLISLLGIDYLNQSAELHIMIGDSINQGKGIGYYAVMEMLKHAFDNLNLQRVELTVLEENVRAQHLYEKIGFCKEGKKRKAIYKNGIFVDVLLYAVLREEFENGEHKK